MLEEVGVDEGEHQQADAFDAHYHVLVLFHALNVAFVALKRPSDDPDVLAGLEVGLVEDLTLGGVVGGQQPEQLDRAGGYHLYLLVAGVAVDPERNRQLGMLTAFGFEFQGILARCADEQYARDDSTRPAAFTLYPDFLLRE